MTATEKMALVYGLSVAGAAAVSYSRGRRGFAEIGQEAVLHGVLVGTGVNVVVWLSDESKQQQVPVAAALPNAGQDSCKHKGNLGVAAITALSQINPEVLYKAAKIGGISIGPETDNPHDVSLPQS